MRGYILGVLVEHTLEIRSDSRRQPKGLLAVLFRHVCAPQTSYLVVPGKIRQVYRNANDMIWLGRTNSMGLKQVR